MNAFGWHPRSFNTDEAQMAVKLRQGPPEGARRMLWKALDGKDASATRIQAAMPAWYACAVPSLSTASGSPAADSRMPVTAQQRQPANLDLLHV